MEGNQVTIKNLARLLESAAKKLNEGADATYFAAAYLYGTDLRGETFNRVFDAVKALAADKKVDSESAARQLLAKVAEIRHVGNRPGAA
jgi:hypothetical protein